MNREKKNSQTQDRISPAKKVSGVTLAPRLVFILSVLVLTLIGLIMVFSASSVEAINNNESPYSYLIKQGLYFLIGVVLAVIIWRKIPISWWRGNVTWAILGVLFLAMLATLVMGTDILGARRWIYIGGVSFQPSEFGKIVLVLVVAKVLFDFVEGLIDVKRFILTLTITLTCVLGLILVGQSDLGTTIICTVGVISVFWVGGAPKKLVFGAIIVVVVLGFVFIIGSGYRSNRLVFLDPYNDGSGGYGAGYQTIRSRYALSEGGFFGVGLGNSHEKFQYLPEAETDYIFAIIGEELGFVGAFFVIFVFVVFLISGLLIVSNCATGFGASIAGAFVIMTFFQACLNILCVIGFAPTTGKPLPFISSGGSSLLATLIMVGFILSASEEVSQPDILRQRRQNIHAYQANNREKFSTYSDKHQNKNNLRYNISTSVSSVKDVNKPGKRQKYRDFSNNSFNTTRRNNKTFNYNKVPTMRKNIKDPSFLNKKNTRRNKSK